MDSLDLSHAAWRKSSRSANGGNCVEVAMATRSSGHMIAVRDSKDRSGPVLVLTPDEWHAFTAGVRAGEFDHI